MPYSKISELPASTKSLSTKQKRKFMEVFNAIEPDIKSGKMDESQAFAIAMTQAKRVKDSVKKSSSNTTIIQTISKQAYSSEEERISIDVVYEPLVKDSHGDWMTAETIKAGCENFNKNYELGYAGENLFHQFQTDKIKFLKSWIHEDFDCVATNGEVIKAGTWLMKTYYEPEIWELKKKGLVGGLSIQCTGMKDKETKEILSLNFDPEYEEEE
jgi:uncharacterized protein YdaT